MYRKNFIHISTAFVLGFLSLALPLFASAQTPAAAATISAVYSCENWVSGQQVNCFEGTLVKDKPYVLIVGSNFSGSTKVNIAGNSLSIEKYNTTNILVKTPNVGSLTEVGVNVQNGDTQAAIKAVPVSVSEAPTPTPTPSVSVTPSPSVSPQPSTVVPSTPAPTTPPPKIENDLSGECAKQGLEYDATSGLCLPANPYQANANSLAGQVTLGGLIKRVLNILLTLAGVVAVLMIVLGGYQYVTSQGADDKAKAGRKTVTNAAIGLVAVLLAYMLVTVVTNFITQGTIF